MAEQVELEVPADLDGARVDKAIARLLGLSRALASRVVESGVWLDDQPVEASVRVGAGQVLRCAQPSRETGLRPEPVDFEVIYEDEAVIVVDKPAGLVVHPGAGRARGTLAAGLLHRFPELDGVGVAGRWGLVHRLDKDTSGALLVARTQSAYEQLSSQVRERRIERVYTALVEGHMEAATGTIEAPIGRDPAQPTRRAVVHDGKPARTHYQVLRYFETGDFSLLEVRLETGRTHQIRVHMAAIGHPIAGDKTYSASRQPNLSLSRPFLHASRLRFNNPATNEEMTMDALLSPDLKLVLAELEEHDAG